MKVALAAGPDSEIMLPLSVAAVETGMRLGELLRMRAEQILSVDGVRHVVQPDSKNGQPRLVVLSSRAWAAMETAHKLARASGPPLFRLGLTKSSTDGAWHGRPRR